MITSCNFLRRPLDSTGKRCNIKNSLHEDSASTKHEVIAHPFTKRKEKEWIGQSYTVYHIH